MKFTFDGVRSWLIPFAIGGLLSFGWGWHTRIVEINEKMDLLTELMISNLCRCDGVEKKTTSTAQILRHTAHLNHDSSQLLGAGWHTSREE